MPWAGALLKSGLETAGDLLRENLGRWNRLLRPAEKWWATAHVVEEERQALMPCLVKRMPISQASLLRLSKKWATESVETACKEIAWPTAGKQLARSIWRQQRGT